MTPLIIVGCYLGLLLLLGLFASRLFRGTSSDYMLASHSIGPFLLLMSLFGTTMTAFALVGSTGEAYSEGVSVYGMLASSSGIIHSLCFFVLGVKLWGFGHRYGYKTQIQFFRDRLESDKIGLVLFPILVGLVIPYLLIGVMASGGVINGITTGRVVDGVVQGGAFEQGTFPQLLEGDKETFATPAGSRGGVPRQLGSLAICGVVLLYVFFGGMRGTAWANAFQTMVFMVLGVVTFCIIADKLGGQDSFFANLRKIGERIPHESLVRDHVTKLEFFSYMLIPFSVGMFPHLFQHWLTAKSAGSFKLSVVLHPVFIMVVWVPCVLIGVWATSDLVKVPPPVHANPNLLLPFIVKSMTTPMLTGFLTAGILAAIMSSLDSQFLCLGTMFTEDIAVHYGGKGRFTDMQVVWIARAFIVGIVALAYFFSLYEPRRVFTLGVWCFSGFSSLFPLAFAAVYWRGLTKAGAYASVLTAFGMWLWLFAESEYAQNDSYRITFDLFGAEYKVMPVAGIFLASAVVLVVVSLVTPKPNATTLAKFFPGRR